MAALSSSSTNEEVWDSFDDNASYEEDSDVSKARKFVTACRILLRRRPERIQTNGYAADFNSDVIQDELDRARDYVATNEASGEGVRYLDFRDIRR